MTTLLSYYSMFSAYKHESDNKTIISPISPFSKGKGVGGGGGLFGSFSTVQHIKKTFSCNKFGSVYLKHQAQCFACMYFMPFVTVQLQTGSKLVKKNIAARY